MFGHSQTLTPKTGGRSLTIDNQSNLNFSARVSHSNPATLDLPKFYGSMVGPAEFRSIDPHSTAKFSAKNQTGRIGYSGSYIAISSGHFDLRKDTISPSTGERADVIVFHFKAHGYSQDYQRLVFEGKDDPTYGRVITYEEKEGKLMTINVSSKWDSSSESLLLNITTEP